MVRDWHVHQYVAHAEVVVLRQRLREEVGQVIYGFYVRHAQLHVFDALTNEEVATIDMLSARV